MHACVQVLGLTVLAWGNSVGDMSTNMAMARKGLANMAMTACYAGPVFNLLVGTSAVLCLFPASLFALFQMPARAGDAAANQLLLAQ